MFRHHLGIAEVELRGIQARDDVSLVAGEVALLIHLVVEDKLARKILHAGEVGIFNNHGCFENTPGMLLEVASGHFAVLVPFVERVGGAMDSDEALAVVMNKREKIV